MAFEQGLSIKIGAEAQDAINAIDNVTDKLEKASENTELKIDPKAIIDAREKLKELVQGMKDAANEGKSFGDSLKSIGGQLTRVADGYINAVKGIFDKIKGFALAGATGVGAALKSAFDVGGGFESSMTSVKIISGATAEEFEKLTAKARELGASLPVTSKDAADAMTIMAQRGTEAKDILENITDVINLSISQNISAADSANILGSAMTNFGLATTEASRVTDIFNNASNQSALTMSKLGEALKFVAPIAKAAGMSLEQAMSAMEVLANSGLDGSMIGTGLSMVISKIAKETEILGIKTQDAQGNIRALADIFTELSQRGVTLSEMTTVFGERAAKSALMLAKNAESLKMLEENLKSFGSTQGAVTQQMNTWRNIVASMGSALESVRLTVFDQLKEKAGNTVNDLTDMVRAFDEWIAKTGAAQKVMQAFLDGLGLGLPSLKSFKDTLVRFNLDAFLQKVKNLGDTVRHVFDTIKTLASIAVTAFNTAYNVIGKHTGVIAEYAQKLLGVSYAAKTVGGALSGLGDLVNALTRGLTKSMSVLSSVGGAFLSASGAVNAFSTAIKALTGGAVIGAAVAGLTALVSKLKETTDAFQELSRSQAQQRRLEFEVRLKLSAREEFDKLKKELVTGFEKISSATIHDENLTKQFEELRKNLQDKTWQKFLIYVRQLNSNLSETEKILAITDTALEKFKPQLEKAFGGDKKAFEALPEQIKLAFEAYKAGFNEEGYDVGIELLNGIKNATKDAWKVLEDQLEGHDVKINMTPFEEFRERVADELGGIVDTFEESLKTSLEITGDYEISVTANVDDAQAKINELAKTVGEKMGLGTGAARAAIENMVQVLADKGDKAAQTLARAFKKPEQEVESLTSRFKDFVAYLGASPSQFMPALKQMLSSVQAIDPATGRVTEAFKKAYSAVKEFANLTLERLKSEIGDISGAIKKGLLDQKALSNPVKQAKTETWLKLKADVDWSSLKGPELDRARAIMVSKFLDSLKDLDEAGSGEIQKHIKELQDAGYKAADITEKVWKELDTQTNKAAKDLKINTLVEHKVNIPSVEQFPKAIADFATAQSGIVQKTQDSVSQISSVGQNLVAALNNLQGAIEQNTAAKGSGSSGGESVSVDTSRLEGLCSTIINTITGVQDDVKGHTSLLAAISNAIANIKGDTTNNYNYDIDVNQTGFTVQSRSDASQLGRMTGDGIRNGLGVYA